MKLTDFYSASALPDTQDTSQPASASRDTTAPAKAPTVVASNAVSISWVGVLLALVLLRVVYEVSE